MTGQLSALLILAPLFTAFLVFGAGWFKIRWCYPLCLISLAICLAAAMGLLLQVIQTGAVQYQMGGWPAPFGIIYHIDHLNALFLPLIAGVALINLISSRLSIENNQKEKSSIFYTLYLLTVTGLLGIVATGDAFNLFVLLEIASLSSYALLATGDRRAPLASLNYLLVGTVGSSFYLLGIGYLYILTGSLTLIQIPEILSPLYASKAVLVAFTMCTVGVFIKMAFFPVHTWLSNTYTFTSSPAASLIAPLTTKVMVYVMLRLMLTVFTPEYVFETLSVQTLIIWLAVGAILTGAILALTAKSLKRMFTYIIIAEVGYMVGGAWLGNRAAMTGTILHIFNDALMTLCVFLAAGNIIYVIQTNRLKQLQGIFKLMPVTMGGLVLGAMSMIGVPPTCGFFSKWYLIQGGLQAGHTGYVFALIFSSLINIVLFFKVFEIGFFEPMQNKHSQPPSLKEAPWSMTLTLVLVALGLVATGLYTGNLITLIIDPAIPASIS